MRDIYLNRPYELTRAQWLTMTRQTTDDSGHRFGSESPVCLHCHGEPGRDVGAVCPAHKVIVQFTSFAPDKLEAREVPQVPGTVPETFTVHEVPPDLMPLLVGIDAHDYFDPSDCTEFAVPHQIDGLRVFGELDAFRKSIRVALDYKGQHVYGSPTRGEFGYAMLALPAGMLVVTPAGFGQPASMQYVQRCAILPEPTEWRPDMTTHTMHACTEATCITCAGGLSECDVCGGAEGAMPSTCPGRRMTGDQLDAVYGGKLDFQAGRWVEPKHRAPPSGIDS